MHFFVYIHVKAVLFASVAELFMLSVIQLKHTQQIKYLQLWRKIYLEIICILSAYEYIYLHMHIYNLCI